MCGNLGEGGGLVHYSYNSLHSMHNISTVIHDCLFNFSSSHKNAAAGPENSASLHVHSK